MFSQLFFVLLALILINFTPEAHFTFWVESPNEALKWGILIYVLLLTLLYWQSKFVGRLSRERLQFLWWPIVNIELLLFLALYHLGLGAHRFFSQGSLSSYQSPFALVSLALYFCALGWADLWNTYFRFHHSFKKSLRTAFQQLLFYCPFCLPYIAMSFLLDGLEHFQFWQNETLPLDNSWIIFLFSLIFLGAVLLFLPALMILCWRCKSLDHPDLKQRLESMCASLNFRHAGLKIWSSMPHTFTAGILGIAAKFRFILFTPALLKRFKPEEIEAILIHEIGHSRHRHLLLYPFILLGMLISGTLLLIGIEFLIPSSLDAVSENHSDFSFVIGIFILYALLMGAYFRLIFGFYSRLFERQADLYIFETSLSPNYLIQAFDRLGVVTGHTHAHPSWHHFSLQERIHFIEQAMENRALIEHHHNLVKKWLYLYFSALVASCLLLYLLLN